MEALPVGSLSRAMAETIPDEQLLTTDGYVLISKKILTAHQAYLGAELEKATIEFLHARAREKGELFTTYVAFLELLGRELDQQLSPAPPLDERIKAIVLLRNCHLDAERALSPSRRWPTCSGSWIVQKRSSCSRR